MIIYVLLWHFGLLFLFIYSFGTCSVFEGCRFRGVLGRVGAVVPGKNLAVILILTVALLVLDDDII